MVSLGPSQVQTCEVVSRPVPGGGSRLSLEKARTQRVAGGCPPAPPGLGPARSSLARFGGRATLSRWRGDYGTHVRTLIWRLSFAKCFFSIFFTRKCVPNRFQHISSNSLTTVPKPTIPKPSEWERAALKPGVQGACPRPSFSPFLGRNGDPRRAGGATGRCALRLRKSPAHPKGTQYPAAPPPGTGREPTLQVLTCAGPDRTTCRFRQRRPARQSRARPRPQ